MKKIFLAAMFAVVVSGAAYAGGSAIDDLNSNAPPSALEGISFEIPEAAVRTEVASKSDAEEFNVKERRYFWLDRNFNRLLTDCSGDVSCQDKLRRDYAEARDDFWAARLNLLQTPALARGRSSEMGVKGCSNEEQLKVLDSLMAAHRQGQIAEIRLRFQGKHDEADKLRQDNTRLSAEIDILIGRMMDKWLGDAGRVMKGSSL